MKPYDPKKIEKKWQKEWQKKGIYRAKEDPKKPKFYGLVEFPYPSGDGLHVGHIKSYTAMDIVARKRRAEGYSTLYPIGWDAFGLPTENYAIKTGIHPKIVTKRNSDNFRRQLQAMGFSFDWSREINTTDPEYYRWTQWMFLKFFENDLAYQASIAVNWCPKCKIGLANEEAEGGTCERCGTKVEKKIKKQWMLRITAYADRLIEDLKDLDFLPQVKAQQINWIGASEGAEIEFPVAKSHLKLKIFTTRPDTLFGVTYLVLAPEHPLVGHLLADALVKNPEPVLEYVETASKKIEFERTNAEHEKTGVRLEGVMAINPASKEEVPVYIADYVLPDYGTGAIMAVPGHDTRDFAFAKKFSIPVKEVIVPNIIDKRNPPRPGKKTIVRKNIHAIVRDPATGKYLALKWKKFDWTTFPMGGVEEGEDVVEAAEREVLEETGFKNLKLVKVLPGQVRAEYFAAHKDENRISYTTAVVFDLIDHERAEVDGKEMEQHDTFWMEASKLDYEHMTHAEVGEWKERLKPGYSVHTEEGVLVNSGKYDGLNSEQAGKGITEAAGGTMKTTYKLRDWVFSRQRYWGEPIPIIHCEECGVVAVPEKDLPVKLPEIQNYQPTETGESPLASVEKWVKVKCPKCKGPARRETDTMPNWAGSSWYFLRYTDPKNKKTFASEKAMKYWMSVDWYNGGMEHTTLHLLYSRFWHKFMHDLKLVPGSEPYKKRTSQGLILAEGGEKMSKSKGNVVNPDAIVELYGADTLRIYEMFMGPFEQAIAWDTKSVIGSRRFIERVWKLAEKVPSTEKGKAGTKTKAETSPEAYAALQQAIRKVSEDIENLRMNTAVSAMMICLNALEKEVVLPRKYFESFLRLLAPFAPHATEELWSALGNKKSIHLESWQKSDEKALVSMKKKIGIQINGKVRGEMEVGENDTEEEVRKAVLALPETLKWTEGKTPAKVIYIKGRLISIVL